MPEVAVKVYVRVRPLLEVECLRSREECLRVVSSDQLLLGRERAFRFDKVLPPSSTQESVYECVMPPLLDSCLEGYNSTVFAYGQTGAGKSFTMGSEAYRAGPEGRGIVPRALDSLFQRVQAKISGCGSTEVRVRVSYLEVYKEELRDLLDGEMRGIHIREDEAGNTVVVGCVEQEVGSSEEALGWLEAGNAARITGTTQMNQRSSRSHAIYTVHIEQKRRVLEDGEGKSPSGSHGDDLSTVEEHMSAKFHFVDLAGSERVSRTGNRGERFKESVFINSGLLALGNVISALAGSNSSSSSSDAKRKPPPASFPHVPYRDSKITRLLKDSLGGNARTVMLTCVSPAADSFAETLNSLRYAKRARNIRNRPVVNLDPQAGRVRRMQNEIQALRDELLKTRAFSLKSSSEVTMTTLNSSVIGQSTGGRRSYLLVGSRLREVETELKCSQEVCAQFESCLVQARGYISQLKTGVPLSSDLYQQLSTWLHRSEQLGKTDKTAQASTKIEPALSIARQSEIQSGLDCSAPSSGSVEPSFSQSRGNVLSKSVSTQVSSSSALSPQAVDTINQLKTELERCKTDLQTDEDLFAQKVEEFEELQNSYEELLRERDRVQGMWMAAQNSHRQLQLELQSVLEHVGFLEKQISEREVIIMHQHQQQQQQQALRGNETSGGTVRDSPSGAEVVLAEEIRAKHSLIQGKVELSSSTEAFSRACVVRSLQRLTQCLAEEGTITAVGADWGTLLGLAGGAASKDTLPLSHKPSKIRVLSSAPSVQPVTNHHQPVDSNASSGVEGELTEQEVLERPITPSEREPLQSRASSHHHSRSPHREGEGRGCEGGEGGRSEMDLLNESTLESKKQLMAAEEKLADAHDNLKSLNLKVCLKEELIRELVKNSNSTRQLNSTYLTKIQSLEREMLEVQRELSATQTSVDQQKSRASNEKERQKIIREHQRKLAVAESKLSSLQQKQRETQRMVQYSTRCEKRVGELESEVERLRAHQEGLRRKLKTQSDKKTRLESDLQKYQHRMQSLQTHSAHQTKVLRIKTQEVAAVQRKLRHFSASRPGSLAEEEVEGEGVNEELAARKVWLDGEVEKVVQQRQAMETLQKELSERERIVTEREALLTQRASLEVKRLSASQAAAKDIVRLSLQIDSLESSIDLAQSHDASHTEELVRQREELKGKCEVLKSKLEEGSVLSPAEQIRYHELNERIEILGATLDFKNDSITSKQLNISQLALHGTQECPLSSELQEHLSQLPLVQARSLVTHYFSKVVRMRVREGKHSLSLREVELRLAEQAATIHTLQRTLKHSQLEADRHLLSLQKNYEGQIHVLLQQIASLEASTPLPSHVSQHHSLASTPLPSHKHQPHSSSSTPLTSHEHQPHSSSSTPLPSHEHQPHSSASTPLPSHEHQPHSSSSTPLTSHEHQPHPSASTAAPSSDHKRVAKLQAKVKALEKDLYYYKKTSRDLKRQASQQQRGSVDRGVGPGLRPQELGIMETQDSKGIESRDSSCMESRDHGDVERRRQNEGQAQSSVERQLATRSAVVRKPKRQLRQLSARDIADRRRSQQGAAQKD